MDLFLVTASALFSVLNPLGAMPVFLPLTANDSENWGNVQNKRASIYVAAILIIFFLIGTYILNFFGISIEGMRIAGGIIIAQAGYELLNAKPENPSGKRINKKVKEEAITKRDISFSPLAMPLLAGPGSISLLISLSLEHRSTLDYASIIAAVLVNALAVFLILRVAPRWVKFLGNSGIAAMSRMMGFIELAIGVQFIANGVIPLLKTIF